MRLIRRTVAALSLAGMAVCGAAFAVSGTRAKTVDAKVVRAAESGYCVVPSRQSANYRQIKLSSSEAEEFDIEPQIEELVQINFRVEIPLIKGCVPSAAAETSSVTDETVTPSPEGKAWAAQEAQPAMRYLGRYWCTGYDTCAKCCGKSDGVTASGTQATVGRTCAASKDLPFGTRLYIEGIGERIVEDRGGGVNGAHIDVLCQDHAQCYEITGWYEVWIVEG